MNCKNCGAPLNETDRFCQSCGMVVDGPVAQQNNQQNLNENEVLGGVNNTFSQMNTQAGTNEITNKESNVIGTENNQMYQAPMQNYNQIPNQPPVGQSINNNSFEAFNNKMPSKKNNNQIVIIMGIIIVILLVIVVFLALNGNKTTATKTNNEEKNTQTTQPTNTENTNKTSVVLDEYTLNIPNEYTQETQGSGIILYTDTKAMYLEVLTGYTLNQIDMEMTKANIEAEGYTVLESVKKQYNGVNMASFGVEMSGQKMLVAYAELPNKSILCTQIMNISGELDYEVLENEFAPIVKSAKYQATSNSIATNDTYKQMKKFIEGKK